MIHVLYIQGFIEDQYILSPCCGCESCCCHDNWYVFHGIIRVGEGCNITWSFCIMHYRAVSTFHSCICMRVKLCSVAVRVPLILNPRIMYCITTIGSLDWCKLTESRLLVRVHVVITIAKSLSNTVAIIHTHQHHHFFLPSIFSERPPNCRPDCVGKRSVILPNEPPPELSLLMTLISDITHAFLAVNSTIVEHSSAAFLFWF